MGSSRRSIPRVIPVLLIKDQELTKTIEFGDETYVGDPINAVRVFNEKEVDEIVILDIDASPENRGPRFQAIEEIASEAFMPLTYGGGVSKIEEVEALFRSGVDKVCLNTVCYENLGLVSEAAAIFGSQSIIASVDVRHPTPGEFELFSASGTKRQSVDLVQHLSDLEKAGIGEIIINSIDRDGRMDGYDLELIRVASEATSVPVVALGGCGKAEDLNLAISAGASAAAAGSFFVFFGKFRAVLITYPSRVQLMSLFEHAPA